MSYELEAARRSVVRELLLHVCRAGDVGYAGQGSQDDERADEGATWPAGGGWACHYSE